MKLCGLLIVGAKATLIVPYRLVYKTHFLAPKSDSKRRDVSYT